MKQGQTMRRLVGCLVFTAMTGGAAAGELTLDVLSAYVWRGRVFNDEAVAQPGFRVTTPAGPAFGAWASIDLTGRNGGAGDLREINLTVSYALPIGGPLGLELGWIQYAYPNGEETADGEEAGAVPGRDDTQEVFLSATLDTLLSPTIVLFYDIDAIAGLYAEAGIGHETELGEDWLFEIRAALGYGNADYHRGHFGVAEASLNDLTVSVQLAHALSPALSVAAVLSHTRLLDGGLREAAEDSNRSFGGLHLRYGF